jgi:hypothetical protein
MEITNEHLEDWRRGEDSTILPLERLELMNEWLYSNKKEVLTSTKVEVKEENNNIGFDDLPMYE